jgi:hypothetical protein
MNLVNGGMPSSRRAPETLGDSELEIPSVESSLKTAPAGLAGYITASYVNNSPLRSPPPRNSRFCSVATPLLEYQYELPQGPEDYDSALLVAAMLHDSLPLPNPSTPRVTTSP